MNKRKKEFVRRNKINKKQKKKMELEMAHKYFFSEYSIEGKPNFPNEKVTPIANEIIQIFEKNELTFIECYLILNFIHKALKYKQQFVNL